MITVGVIGRLCAGKSTLIRQVQDLDLEFQVGAASLDREIILLLRDPDAPGHGDVCSGIRTIYGECKLAEEGGVAYPWLESAYFSQRDKADRLRALLRPFAQVALSRSLDALRADHMFVLVEGASFATSDTLALVDWRIVSIRCHFQECCERLSARDGSDPATARRRVRRQVSARQLAAAEREARALGRVCVVSARNTRDGEGAAHVVAMLEQLARSAP